MVCSEGESYFGDEICDIEDLKKTEFYNDFLLKCDTRFFWGLATLKRDLRLETISLYTSWKSKPPSDDAANILDLVTPHIKSALRIRSQLLGLECAKRSFEDSLHKLPKAAVLLGRSGKCLFVNEAAQRLLNRKQGLSVMASKLVATNLEDRAHLDALIRNCCSGELLGSGSGVVAVHRMERKPLVVSVRQFRQQYGMYSDQAVAIVFIADPDAVEASPENMALAFGLTPAESRVCSFLLDGCTLQETADRAQVTRETVKAQVKSIFNKTGVRRQSELLKLLMSYG
jgi:DNA-binding CsgD family transcriptional regulator